MVQYRPDKGNRAREKAANVQKRLCYFCLWKYMVFLKWTVPLDFFASVFFAGIIFPRAPDYNTSNFFENRENIRSSRKVHHRYQRHTYVFLYILSCSENVQVFNSINSK
jgi:hypothetical protein